MTEKSNPTPKFRVGDLVRIRQNLRGIEEILHKNGFSSIPVTDEMKELEGIPCAVLNVKPYEYGFVYLLERYDDETKIDACFQDWMLTDSCGISLLSPAEEFRLGDQVMIDLSSFEQMTHRNASIALHKMDIAEEVYELMREPQEIEEVFTTPTGYMYRLFGKENLLFEPWMLKRVK